MSTNVIKKSLLELGCNENEIQIYEQLTLRRIGVTDLSKMFGITRIKTYQILNSLEVKGILQKSDKYSRTLQPCPPNHLLTLLKLKISKSNHVAFELDSALPDIILGFDQSSSNSNLVESGVGEKEFIRIYDNFIKEASSSIVCFANPVILNNIVDFSFLRYWLQKRVNKKLSIRILVPEEHIWIYQKELEIERDKEFLRETRGFKNLGSSKLFEGTFYVSGSLVVFCDPISLIAIKINNSVIARTITAMFELAWSRGVQF